MFVSTSTVDLFAALFSGNTPNDIYVKQVYLLNILGQTIKTWNATNSASFSSNEIKIPVKGVSEGSYIIKVETSKGSINKKIVIID